MESDVFRRIDELMREQKKKNIDLNNYLGLTRTTYDNWKRGRSKSYLKHINRISEYLHVSPNYLLNGIEGNEERIDNVNRSKEEKLIRLFRSISEKDADLLLNLVYAFVNSVKNVSVDTAVFMCVIHTLTVFFHKAP